VQDFLQDLAIDHVLDLLTDGENALLQVAASLEIPVPEAVFNNIANEVGIQKDVDYKKRLLGFGVIEQFEDLVYSDIKSYLLNNIIRPRIEKLSSDSFNDFTGIITETLFAAWCADKERYRPWICDKEIVKFGLIAKHLESVAVCAENCIRGMHHSFRTKEAAHYAILSITLLENNKENVPAGLYEVASNVSHQVGYIDNAEKYIYSSIRETEENEDNFYNLGKYYGYLGRILIQKGKVKESLEKFESAGKYFSKAKALRELAINSGDIAGIKVDKGEVDEALKLYQETIQVFDKLGDTREKAVTLGDIARIKLSKGEVDEALKLHEEELDVYDKLCDTRSKAVTLGDIARIKLSKGKVDEALKLHEEELDVYDKLCDTRSKAVTLGDIARIKLSKGEVDEALKLHEERIQVFEKLGDIRSKAVTLGDIARIKLSKGKVDEALKLHQEMIQVFEKLVTPDRKP